MESSREAPPESPPPANPYLALALTILLGGLGHFYAGYSFARCVAIYAAMLLAAFTLATLASLIPVWQATVGLTVAGNVALILFLAWHCLIVVRRNERVARRWIDYAALATVIMIMGVGFRLGMETFQLRPIQIFRVPTRSMEPNIIPGDRIICSATPYAVQAPPEAGDVIAFFSPTQDDVTYVKRIVGMPGDRIRVTDDVVYINESPLQRTPLGDSGTFEEINRGKRYLISNYSENQEKSFNQDLKTFRVPDHEYFVLGDWRRNSADSRTYGPVPREAIRGRCDAILWGNNAPTLSPAQRRWRLLLEIK